MLSSPETFVFNKILGEGLTAKYFSKQTFQWGSLLQRLSGMEVSVSVYLRKVLSRDAQPSVCVWSSYSSKQAGELGQSRVWQ